MANIKDPKKIHKEIVERNRKEKARVMKLLEAEGITEKSAAEVLQEFTQNGFPLTLEGVLRMIIPLKARYGQPKIRSSTYPAAPSPIPLNWKYLGKRLSLEFPNGQNISIVIANDGKTIIKRF